MTSTATSRHRLPILGVPVDLVSLDAAVARVLAWGAARESRYVCLCNVHAVVTAGSDPTLLQALADADLVAPDGAPVAFVQRRLGATGQRRVAGPDLMPAVLARAAAERLPVYLYGSTPQTLRRLETALRARWPALPIAGSMSPPFAPLSDAQMQAHAQAINDSGAAIVWVGLGCPKQERWMHAQRGQVRAAMVGVGAAFDFLAGTQARAPMWMQRAGLEWLHRAVQEPRRLARRYAVTNSVFVWRTLWQWLRSRRGR